MGNMERVALRFNHPFFTGSFCILAALAFLYSVSLGHNFFFDEEAIILHNPLIRDLARLPKLFEHGYFYHEIVAEGIWSQYFRPFTSLTFALDFQLWKVDPFGYNLTNLLLHGTVTILLFWFIHRLVEHLAAAFWSALVFGIHPIQTEAVTYIASRGDLLGTMGVILCLFFYWRGRSLAALIVYGLSLLAKESSLLVPLYVLLFDFVFIRERFQAVARRIAPFILVTLLYVAWRKFFVAVPFGPPSWDFPGLFLRPLSMGIPLVEYLQALLAPDSFKYCAAITTAGSLWDERVLISAFVFLAWAVGGSLLYRRRGAAFFGFGLFSVALLPYVQIFKMSPQWAEHYLYLPMVGLALMAARLGKELLESPTRRVIRAAVLVLFIPYLTFLGLRTYQRNTAYNDPENFYWLITQTGSPFADTAFIGLGGLAADGDKDWSKAAVYYRTAIAIEPQSEKAHYNLGIYHLRRSEWDKAYSHFKEAYYLAVPDFISLHNAAVALARMGRYVEAASAFEAAQKMNPDSLKIYVHLLVTYELMGDLDKGIAWIDEGLEQFKKNDSARSVLCVASALSAYRQGRDTLVYAMMDRILAMEKPIPWLVEIARLLSGRTSMSDFEKAVAAKHPEFQEESNYYKLIYYVMKRQREPLGLFLKRYPRIVAEQPGKDAALIQKELARVEKLMA